MANKAHKLLTGTDLHEPKGVETALSGQVYISNGAGSGTWTTINTDIGFSTGDVKPTLKPNPDTGWIMASDGTIGSASSGAGFANGQAQALFSLIWSWVPTATVSPSRGGSAAADWVANKTITLPKFFGRNLAVAGQGSGLTFRNLGDSSGSETVTLGANNVPAHTHPITDPGHVHGPGALLNNVGGITSNLLGNITGSGISVLVTTTGAGVLFTTVSAATGITVNANTGGGQAFSVMNPAVYVNIMIKL